MAADQDLDLTFLFEIADGSNEFIVDSIDMFMQQTPELLKEIESAMSASDWPGLAGAAHKLKPNLGFFGMSDCQALLQDIENLAKNDVPDVALISEKVNETKRVLNVNMPKLLHIKTTAANDL